MNFSVQHQKFIIENENADVRQLALKAHLYPHLPIPELIVQIATRQKAKTKLPTFYAEERVIYPSALSLEQCSSEQTATYKANLVKGKLLIDLTGGLGVDAFFFSRHFEKVIYVERNEDLAAIAKHNFEVLGAKHITVINSDAQEFIKKFHEKVDYIYLDPARRDQANRKVVLLEDCEPNILGMLPLLDTKVVLKTSPMLDIDLATRSLGYVTEVLILAVENECKEVVYFIDKNHQQAQFSKNQIIKTVHLAKNQIQTFSFHQQEEETVEVPLALPQNYLYEPNAAILKAGAFKTVAKTYGINKLAIHTHLYTSTHLVENFAGRIFHIQAICKLDKKELASYLPDNKANITVRNFPLSVEEIRKKTSIKDGGDIFLFAITNCEGKKVVLVSKRVS